MHQTCYFRRPSFSEYPPNNGIFSEYITFFFAFYPAYATFRSINRFLSP